VTVDEYWTKVEQCGWLENLSEEERDELRRSVEARAGHGEDQMFLGLATGGFDVECIEDDGSYPMVLESYRKASRGVFNPSNVTSRLDETARRGHVAFELGGKRFHTTVPFESDYFEGRVHDLINRSLAHTGAKERFFDLPSAGQIAFLVCVEPSLHRRARERGVIPSDDWDSRPPAPQPSRAEQEASKQKQRLAAEALERVRDPDPDVAMAAARDLARTLSLKVSDQDYGETARRARERAENVVLRLQEVQANDGGDFGTLRHQARLGLDGVSPGSRMTTAFAREMSGAPDMPHDGDLDWTRNTLNPLHAEGIEREHCHDPKRMLVALDWLLEAASREGRVARELWEARETSPYAPAAFAASVRPDLKRMADLCRGAAARYLPEVPPLCLVSST